MTSKRRRSGGEPVPTEQESMAQGMVANAEVAVSSGNLDTVTPDRMKPGLEAALERFAHELRRELQRAAESIHVLRSEVAELNTRYEAHTHSVHPVSAASGAMWSGADVSTAPIPSASGAHDRDSQQRGTTLGARRRACGSDRSRRACRREVG